MEKNKINYTENDRAIVNALRDHEDGYTLNELRTVTGLDLKAGHIVSAMKKGLISAIGEVESIKNTTRKVGTYSFVTDEVRVGENGKPFNYTEGEQNILRIAKDIEGSFTLAQLADALGVTRVTSGSINGLVKKGNFEKGDQVEVPAISKSMVKVYGFVADIPAAE